MRAIETGQRRAADKRNTLQAGGEKKDHSQRMVSLLQSVQTSHLLATPHGLCVAGEEVVGRSSSLSSFRIHFPENIEIGMHPQPRVMANFQSPYSVLSPVRMSAGHDECDSVTCGIEDKR